MPTGWRPTDLPASYADSKIEGNGAVWFRRKIVIPPEWRGRDLVLSLGVIDDWDRTYFNGHPAGETTVAVENYWMVRRLYRIPAKNIMDGENTIAVRVMDHGGGGGFFGPAEAMHLSPVDTPDQQLALTGEWLAKPEYLIDWRVTGRPPFSPTEVQARRPSSIYNGMISPLQAYPVRGILWYQGEFNVMNAREYAKYFPLLIESWRREWRDPAQPFIFAQLAALQRHTPGQPLPSGFFDDLPPAPENNWSELREAQAAALRLPHTGMAICIDIGDPIDIHPTNKQDVGRRMALEALRIAYGRDIVSSGPLYRGMTIETDSIRLHFDHVGSGLMAKGGALRQFAIAGADRVFHRAEAIIDGDNVIVRSPQVGRPMHVRYAWATYPDGCNLYNREGLPASPFRTDTPDYLQQLKHFK